MDVVSTGFSQPVTAPLYPDPPYLYRGAKVLLGVYEADAERIAPHLPPGVTPLEDPVRCIAWVCHYPFTTFGSYNEAILLVRVSFEGAPYNYCPFIYVNAESKPGEKHVYVRNPKYKPRPEPASGLAGDNALIPAKLIANR